MILLFSILLGALLGECHGLQAGFQYHYQYTGTLATWIPNDPTQSSGSALRAVVVVQLTEDDNILVKASNIEVGERNGKDACEAYTHAEFPYREMDPQDAALLETPFLVNASRAPTEKSYMLVPEEPVWVTNIRRGIINTLPLLPLMGQFFPTLTFGLKEDTMIGSCFNWYSKLKLSDYVAKLESRKQEELIEVDAQRERVASYSAPKGKGRKVPAKGRSKGRSKTPQLPAAEYTAPSIQDTLFTLTRTLDDEQCKEKHFTMKINGNKESVERTQRHSVGNFLMRGDGKILRLERAEVLGDVVIYTGESDEEFIRTTSKQVLQLRAVTQVEETFPITYVPERRSVSFSVADGTRATIKEKLLGISPDEQQTEANMAGIMEDLSALIAVNNMHGEERPVFLETFQRVVERITISSWTEIEDVITRMAVTEREEQIIYQALLASGRDDILTAILEKMKDHSFRGNHMLLVFQIMEAPTTPVRNPAILPTMLEVASAMSGDEEGSKAASLINIAKLAHRYCLNPQTANTCDQRCDIDFILNTFLPMLSQGLQDPLKWKKLINIYAMCSLGTPYSMAFLQPIIEGTSTEDIDVRITAIFCLSSENLPKTSKEMVFDTLMPLLNNPTEFPGIRNVAFIILSTWKPSLSWWEHVAISTWKENSTQVINFISSTLIHLSSVNEPRSNYAKKVVHLAKHPLKSDTNPFASSAYIYLNEVVKNCEARSSQLMGWLLSMKSSFPSLVYYKLQFVTVMGMTRTQEVLFYSNALKYIDKYLKAATQSAKRYEDSMTFQEIYDELKEELGLPTIDTSDDDRFELMLSSGPLPLIITLFSDRTLNIREELETNQHRLIYELVVKNSLLHLRLADSTLVFPSDLGLPILIKHEEDFAFTAVTEIRFSLKIEHSNTLKTSTLVPWSGGLTTGAGVEAILAVTFPLIKINAQEILETRTVIMELLDEEKVNIIYRSNMMYTSLTPLYRIVDTILTPEESDSNNIGRKVLQDGEMQEISNTLFPENMGIHLKQEWKGDFESPDNINFFNNMSVSQLKYSNFRYRLVLDPRASRTKKVTLSFNFDIKEREEGLSEQVHDYYGQERQGADEYELSQGFEDFGQISVDGIEQQSQHSQTLSSHLEKMQALMMSPVAGAKVYTVTLTVEPQDSLRKYEIAINLASSRGNIGEIVTNIQKMHVTLLSHPMPGVISDTHVICLDLRMEKPLLLPLVTKEILLETSLPSNVVFSLYKENNCEGLPAFKLQGTLDVNSAAIQSIDSTEERDTCDENIPSQIYPFYNQVHLKFTGDEDFVGWLTASSLSIASVLGPNDITATSNEGAQLDNEISVDALLNREEGEWSVTLVTPQETAVFLVDGSPLPVPFTGPEGLIDYKKFCHLTHQSVKTYDGLLHPFEPSSCWTTATIVPFSEQSTNSNSYLDIAIQVRFTDTWEVRLISPISALVLDVTRSHVLVNEEPFSGHSEKFVVQHLQNSQIVGIGMVAVQVGDTVDIMVSDDYHGKVMGICGNNDRETVNDMMGPTGCLYTDPTLYTVAWNTAGVGCSRFTLRNEKRRLTEYREDCDKVIFQPTGLLQENAMTNCTEWKYDERNDATGLYCKSKIPYSACRPDCYPSKSSAEYIGYSCWMPSSAGQSGVNYGENNECFSTISPVSSFSSCFRP